MKKFFIGKTAMVLAAAAATGAAVMPMAVFAENGVQNPLAETWTTTKGTDGAISGSWGTDDGRVDLTYDTVNGKWTDSKGVQHDNGTYVVRIPKAITYEGMNVGIVNTTDNYGVTVEGVLAGGKSIDVSAETGKKVTGANLLGDITETTSLVDGTAGGKAGVYAKDNLHNFTAAQVSVMNADSSKVVGTTVQDNIKLAGTALSAGTYTGTVQYTATLK